MKNLARKLAARIGCGRMPRGRRVTVAAAAGLLVTLPAAVLVSCGDDGEDAGAVLDEAVATYAQGVHASYSAALATAQDMDRSIDAFLASPSDESLKGARDAWLSARSVYGPSEVFRFYGGPIDDEETGKEGHINAWPLDEGYIDYVEGNVPTPASSTIPGIPSIDAPPFSISTRRAARPTCPPAGTPSSSCCGARTAAPTAPATARSRTTPAPPTPIAAAGTCAVTSDLLMDPSAGAGRRPGRPVATTTAPGSRTSTRPRP